MNKFILSVLFLLHCGLVFATPSAYNPNSGGDLGTGTAGYVLRYASTNVAENSTIYCDRSTGFCGINNATPTERLDVTGNIKSTGLTVNGAATGTTFNKLTLTTPASGSTFTLINGKTFTVNKTITLEGTDSTTITFQGTDTYVGRATTDTLTNKRITKRVTTASDATSITPNSDNADITYQANTQSVGTLTINADAGTCTNGQSWLLKIKSTNVQTFSWNAVYVGGTIALPASTTGGGKIDYFAFLCDTVNSKLDYTGTAGGF